MTNSYVIGGGVAGLTLAYCNPEFIVIDANPFGQLSSRYNLGPRIIQANPFTAKFFDLYAEDLNLSPMVEFLRVGYERCGEISAELRPAFKEKYCTLARGSGDYESSFLSGSNSWIAHFVFESFEIDEYYKILFKRMYKRLIEREQIVHEKVRHVDLDNRFISTGSAETGYTFCYDEIVSTVRHDITCGFTCELTSKLKMLNKNFCITRTTDENKELLKTFHYVYSIDGIYTRKTIYPTYTVYETVDPFLSDIIDGSPIIEKINNLPIQLAKSEPRLYANGIRVLGRFAQLDHSVRFDTLIEKCMNWRER